jgi:hypothetical protein
MPQRPTTNPRTPEAMSRRGLSTFISCFIIAERVEELSSFHLVLRSQHQWMSRVILNKNWRCVTLLITRQLSAGLKTEKLVESFEPDLDPFELKIFDEISMEKFRVAMTKIQKTRKQFHCLL